MALPGTGVQFGQHLHGSRAVGRAGQRIAKRRLGQRLGAHLSLACLLRDLPDQGALLVIIPVQILHTAGHLLLGFEGFTVTPRTGVDGGQLFSRTGLPQLLGGLTEKANGLTRVLNRALQIPALGKHTAAVEQSAAIQQRKIGVSREANVIVG